MTGVQTCALDLVAGANGAGKSTLLRCLAGLLRPRQGSIAFEPSLPERERKRAVGLLDHEPLVSEDLTLSDNLLVFARLFGLEDPMARVDALLGEAGLRDAASKPVRECSAGQVRRLALARTFLHEPRLWLLDEPFANLDDEGRAWLERCMDAHRNSGGLAVVASHEPRGLDRIVTRRARLEQGTLIAGT